MATMILATMVWLAAGQVNPGLPVPTPPDLRDADLDTICFVTLAAAAEERRKSGRDPQELDREVGYYWAGISRRLSGGALDAVLDTARKQASPSLRPLCGDRAAADFEGLRRSLSGKPMAD